ncbi:ATPase [Mycobacterium sp. Y57]|nr:ATPase [Mycolicibacterium xanthum]MBX7432075.1 ATPase [Mycolicibacterium xanthum]
MCQLHASIVAGGGRAGRVYVRLIVTLLIVLGGVVLVPDAARAAPGVCPPACDVIPDSAWIDAGSVPLFGEYRWPGLASAAVTAPAPRFEFESWCAGPDVTDDARDYAVAARAVVRHPDGQWNLLAQVMHWRGDTVTGGRTALQVLELARIALARCQLTAPDASPSITTSTATDLVAVISESGDRVMHTYLLADPASSTVVELTLWTTLPAQVDWRAEADTVVLDAMALPLCATYLGSCR